MFSHFPRAAAVSAATHNAASSHAGAWRENNKGNAHIPFQTAPRELVAVNTASQISNKFRVKSFSPMETAESVLEETRAVVLRLFRLQPPPARALIGEQ